MLRNCQHLYRHPEPNAVRQRRLHRTGITTYQYDANGNLTQITDPLGRIRKYQFDALNQAVRQLEPNPTIIGSTLGQIDTTYDHLGQITSITDPRNLTTRYGMDSLGNLLKQTSPDTGITDASYDETGNLKTRTDARGKTAIYSYDSLSRIRAIGCAEQSEAHILRTDAPPFVGTYMDSSVLQVFSIQ